MCGRPCAPLPTPAGRAARSAAGKRSGVRSGVVDVAVGAAGSSRPPYSSQRRETSGKPRPRPAEPSFGAQNTLDDVDRVDASRVRRTGRAAVWLPLRRVAACFRGRFLLALVGFSSSRFVPKCPAARPRGLLRQPRGASHTTSTHESHEKRAEKAAPASQPARSSSVADRGNAGKNVGNEEALESDANAMDLLFVFCPRD